MKTKTVGFKRLVECGELLREIYDIDEDGNIIRPKFINFELITEKQAKKRGIDTNCFVVNKKEKFGQILMTITSYILIEDKETTVILDSSGMEKTR